MITSKHSKKYKNSIQRGRKLDLKGIYQHPLLSLKFTLLLLGIVLSILSPPIYNLFLLFSIPPPPPLFGLDPSMQKGRKKVLKEAENWIWRDFSGSGLVGFKFGSSTGRSRFSFDIYPQIQIEHVIGSVTGHIPSSSKGKTGKRLW